MSWYSTGAEAADQIVASSNPKRRRNFFTQPGESATIRFLKPADESFNYKRSFVKWARGEKMQTSPQTIPDPFEQAGLQLQNAFAWLVLDRRVLTFKDKSGEEKTIGPRVLYFADGQRTRKQLQAFEKEMLIEENERRAEDNLDPIELKDFNLTHYDLKVSKEKGAPWNFVGKRPKDLTKADKELIEKESFDLIEELAPASEAELKALLGGAAAQLATESEDDDTTSYSYSDDDEDTIKFD